MVEKMKSNYTTLVGLPPAEEIEIEDYDPGDMRVVEMHDGSHIQLRKLEKDYDPTDKMVRFASFAMGRTKARVHHWAYLLR